MNSSPFPTWKKGEVHVDILHSIAGLATQILIKNLDNAFSFLIDCGDGTTRDIVNSGIEFNKLFGLAITHGHYDHCSGLHSLLSFLRMLGRVDDFYIFYPEGCIEVEGIIQNFKTCYQGSTPFTIISKKINARLDSFNFKESLTLKAIQVLHYGSTLKYVTGERIPALGYEITINNIKISYSGDTGPTDTLKTIFTKETDLGIIEATHPDDSWVKDKKNRYHLTEKEAIDYTSVCRDQIIIHRLHKSVIENRQTK
ncbi:MAG: MBL fold metallo-hydrolase [Candidatus Hodarchaeales archaeon]